MNYSALTKSLSLPLTCLSMLGLSGCNVDRGWLAPRHDPGTLEMTAANDMRSLDPAHAYDVQSWGFERLIYSGLLDYDQGTRLVPKAARAWKVSPDGKTYTFFLRRDVHFQGPLTHNRLVTSQDFAYELRRVLGPDEASQGLDFFTPIVGAEAFHAKTAQDVTGLQTPDPFTLIIHLEKPSPAFLNIMAMPFAYAVPHEVVDKYKAPGFTEHAEGSGPFVLAEWNRQADIRFTRNPNYFEKGMPKLRAVHETFGVDDLNSMMMFETGELDLSGIPSADFVRITHDPKYSPYTDHQVQMAIYYLSLNCEIPPLDNVKVRQAINYAIDRKKILRLINNRGMLATGVLPPGMPGYDPALQGYPYDPSKARQLLKEAGQPNGFKTVLWVRSSGGTSQELDFGQSIQQDLKAVGIQIDIKPVAFPIWLSATGTEKQVPMTINDWYEDFPDPSDFLDVLLNSKQAVAGTANNNNAFYKSPAMDKLLDTAASMTDPQRRLELYRQANRLAVHDAPWVFLYYPVSYELRRPWVHGYEQHPVWPARFEQIWFSAPGISGNPLS